MDGQTDGWQDGGRDGRWVGGACLILLDWADNKVLISPGDALLSVRVPEGTVHRSVLRAEDSEHRDPQAPSPRLSPPFTFSCFTPALSL